MEPSLPCSLRDPRRRFPFSTRLEPYIRRIRDIPRPDMCWGFLIARALDRDTFDMVAFQLCKTPSCFEVTAAIQFTFTADSEAPQRRDTVAASYWSDVQARHSGLMWQIKRLAGVVEAQHCWLDRLPDRLNFGCVDQSAWLFRACVMCWFA